jgi:hypothetical protein
VRISSQNFDSGFCCVYSCSERKSRQVSICRIGPFPCQTTIGSIVRPLASTLGPGHVCFTLSVVSPPKQILGSSFHTHTELGPGKICRRSAPAHLLFIQRYPRAPYSLCSVSVDRRVVSLCCFLSKANRFRDWSFNGEHWLSHPVWQRLVQSLLNLGPEI